MSREKKKLLQSINKLEARIKETQHKRESDRKYLEKFYDRNQLILVTLLVPAFLTGWEGGKLMRGKRGLKPFTKYALLTCTNIFRRFNRLI